MSRLRSAGKRAARQIFEAGQRIGVDVLPKHFYSPIPDIRELRRQRSWRARRSMASIGDASLEAQLLFVHCCCPPDVVSRSGQGVSLWRAACAEHDFVGYGPIEALFLYCFVATQKPARIIQVGAGVSTSIILRAAADSGYEPRVECIDPFPTTRLSELASSRRLTLSARPAQDVAIEDLSALGLGDLLFVDSTHAVKPGSEVNHLILEVLPRLGPGVWAHFHDIFFPYDYGPTVLSEDMFFWNETALLHAFLSCNETWRLKASLSMLHHSAPSDLQRIFPAYVPARFEDGIMSAPAEARKYKSHFPSAAYLQRDAEISGPAARRDGLCRS